MKFNSKEERYRWMVKTSPDMVKKLKEFKDFFGDIKLSGVGKPVDNVKHEVTNLWENMGIKTK